MRASGAYFAIVFAIAFLLGAGRVLFVAPRLGELGGVLLETPAILTISWLASERLSRHYGLGAKLGPRLIMGGMAFVYLMVAEYGLAILLFHRTTADYFAAFLTAPGAIGLAAQLGFAVIPAAQACRRARRFRDRHRES